MSDPVPPAEARAPGDDFLGTFTAEALEELVYYEASRRPSQAAAAVELPPLRLEEGHGLTVAAALRGQRQRCENSTGVIGSVKSFTRYPKNAWWNIRW